jgi:16S rRNA (guanine966-N2)-methyltransferase
MRIISGKFGGRKFYPPADKWPTRPTTDISKEGLFNVLNNRLEWEEVKMLDLFGGTGNHCYEFISRGCTDATYVDQFMGCIKFVQEVSEKLKIEKELKIVRSDVFRFIASTKEQFDYIFAGPPYPLDNIPEIPDLIFEKNLLRQDGLFVLETNAEHKFEQHPHFTQLKKYGTTLFWFFE